MLLKTYICNKEEDNIQDFIHSDEIHNAIKFVDKVSNVIPVNDIMLTYNVLVIWAALLKVW